MSPNEYQRLAKRTLIDKPEFPLSDEAIMVVWSAVGLAGEAGEILDYIKKGIFHRHGVDKEKLKDELGDQLWYLTMLAEQYGLTLENIMVFNIEKLKRRYPNGFSSEDSINRINS
jgi:NTP pyrophosphatase (non-canonical NTP hydrolase)